jgi:hypothetical protein
MTSNAELRKDQTTKTANAVKTKAAKAQAPKSDQAPAVKTKEPKQANASKSRSETAGLLPTTIDELKATKGGLVCYLFFSGKDKGEIAKEFKAAFNVSDAQAAKIIRRITGRVRFYRRVIELMAVK